MTATSRGYRTLPPESAKVESWSVGLQNGQTYENGSPTVDWSRDQALHLSARILIDTRSLNSDLGLPEGARVAVMLDWRTTAVGIRGSSGPVPIAGPEVTVESVIPAGHAGGALLMEVRLVLIHAGEKPSADPLVPSEKGAILWRDALRTQLEGIAPRLPVVVVPLDHSPFYGMHDARWYVRVDSTNMEVPVDAAIRVYLNDGNESVARMLAEPDGDVARVMNASLILDVQREMVNVGLLDLRDDFDDTIDYPDGSLGAALKASIALLPGTLPEKRTRAEKERASFDVELQGRLGHERS